MPRLSTLLLATLLLLPVQHALAGLNDWPTSRQNPERNGRSYGTGTITEPAVVWQADFGGRTAPHRSWFGTLPNYGEVLATAEGGRLGLFTPQNQVIWKTPALGITTIITLDDFDGDGKKEFLVGMNGQPAGLAFVDEQTGSVLFSMTPFGPSAQSVAPKQVIVADFTGDGLPEVVTSPVAWVPDLYAFTFSGGFGQEWSQHLLWTHHYAVYNRDVPQVVADVDHDGQLEIIWLEYRQITVVDGATGVTEMTIGDVFSNYNAGLLGLFEQEGHWMLVVLSYISRYEVAATGVDLSTGQVAWQYQWIPSGGKSLDYVHHSIIDIDGDHTMEVVFSVFGDGADELTTNGSQKGDYDGVNHPDHWVTLVVDGMTGQVKQSIYDARIEAVGQFTGDDTIDLLVRKADRDALLTDPFDPLMLINLSSGQPVVTDTLTGRAPLIFAAPIEQLTNTSGTLNAPVQNDINGDGNDDLLVTADLDGDGNADALEQLHFDSAGRFVIDRQLAIPNGLAITPLESKTEPNRLALSTSAGQVWLIDNALQIEAAINVGGFSAQVLAADLLGTGRPELFFTDGTGTLTVQTDDQQGGFTQNWEKPLHSALWSTPLDIDFDGRPELAVFDWSDRQNPSIELLGGEGALIWQAPLTGFNNKPRAISTAYLNDDDIPDVVLLIDNLLLDNSQDMRLIALDGRNGLPLWNIATRENNWSASPLLVTDLNNDGIDDVIVVGVFHIEYYSGLDGALLHSAPYSRWARSALLANTDGASDFEAVIMTLPQSGGIATYDMLTDTPLVTIPYEYTDEMNYRVAATFGDSDRENIIFPNAQGQLKAYDGDTGTPTFATPLWLRKGQVVTANPGDNNEIHVVTVVDIDGDGADDVLAGAQDGYLSAVRIEDQQLLWSVFLDAQVVDNIVADMDGDGALEVVATTSDGRVHLIDQVQLAGTTEVRDVTVNNRTLVHPERDIDLTHNRTLYGVAFDPVEGATNYEVTVVNEEGLAVTPTLITQQTTAVIETAPRLIGVPYFASVVAKGPTGQTSTPVLSDGVTVVDDAPPSVRRMKRRPGALNPGKGIIQIRATLTDDTWLSSALLEIVDPDGQVVQKETTSLYGLKQRVRFTVDGTGITKPGKWFIRLTVFDSLNQSDVATARFHVTKPWNCDRNHRDRHRSDHRHNHHRH